MASDQTQKPTPQEEAVALGDQNMFEGMGGVVSEADYVDSGFWRLVRAALTEECSCDSDYVG